MQCFKVLSGSKRRLGIITILLILLYTGHPAAQSGGSGEWFVPPEISSAEVYSNRHTHMESGVPIHSMLTTDGFEKKLENQRLEVWFHRNTASIRVVDKASGYTWGMLPEGVSEDMNDRWNAMASSLITLEYYDADRNQNNISLSDPSVEAEYDWQENALWCDMDSTETGISLGFTMKLEEDSLVFSVKEGSLREIGDNKVKALYFAPFLGCTREDSIDGYMFVPDGPGALIRYAKESQYVKPFEARIYGSDYGIDTAVQPGDLKTTRTNDYITDEEQATVPVYGVVHGAGQNALMGVAESGEEYAAILAYPSGVITPYNWAGIRFDYRSLYTEPINQDGSGIERMQQTANNVVPRLRVTFLTGEKADYSGMAVTYRERLRKEGRLRDERLDTQVPLHLNIVGADVKKGFLFKTLSVLTTASQAKHITEELSRDGIRNLTLTFEGWEKGGLNGGKISETSFEKQLGNRGNFATLRDKVKENGGRFYLLLNPVIANKDQISLLSAPAVTISGKQQKIKRMNNQILYNEYYFLKPSFTVSTVERYFNKLDGFNLAFKELGMRLYSDYTRNKAVTRTQARSMLVGICDKYKSTAVALHKPNSYFWDKTGEYFNIPMTCSQYTFETDTVPFLPIVLKGHVDYYTPYANQGFYSRLSVLKMIEFGAYPSFIVAAARNQALHNTPLEDYFSINFDDWHDSIRQVYTQVNEALAAVEGSQIERHVVLNTGIVRVDYTNGKQIFINYTTEPYNIEGREVPPMGFDVRGSQI